MLHTPATKSNEDIFLDFQGNGQIHIKRMAEENPHKSYTLESTQQEFRMALISARVVKMLLRKSMQKMTNYRIFKLDIGTAKFNAANCGVLQLREPYLSTAKEFKERAMQGDSGGERFYEFINVANEMNLVAVVPSMNLGLLVRM